MRLLCLDFDLKMRLLALLLMIFGLGFLLGFSLGYEYAASRFYAVTWSTL